MSSAVSGGAHGAGLFSTSYTHQQSRRGACLRRLDRTYRSLDNQAYTRIRLNRRSLGTIRTALGCSHSNPCTLARNDGRSVLPRGLSVWSPK